MPSIKQNVEMWNDPQSWIRYGEQWSDCFGGSNVQWSFFLRPRLLGVLPAKDILEISPGGGRWTQFLKRECDSLTLVDLSHVAIETCRRRFAKDPGLKYFVNDGLDLSMVPSQSMDLVFTFDSLVHADRAVIESYLTQLPRILKPNGVVFMHHSNLGTYANTRRMFDPLVRSSKVRRALDIVRVLPYDDHMRDWSVSGDLVVQLARNAGLSCITQEFLRWGNNHCFIDCISLLVLPKSESDCGLRRFYNREGYRKIENDRNLAKLYLG